MVGSLVSAPQEGELIEESASLNQAVHQIISGHHQSLLVTRGGNMVGILRLADVFHEVSNRIMSCRVRSEIMKASFQEDIIYERGCHNFHNSEEDRLDSIRLQCSQAWGFFFLVYLSPP